MEKTRDNKQIRENKTKSSSEFMRAHTDKPLFHYPLIQRDSITSLTLSSIFIPSANVSLCFLIFLLSSALFCYTEQLMTGDGEYYYCTHNSCACYADNKTERKCQKPKEAAKEWRKEKKHREAHTLFKKINKQFLLYYNCDCMP